jgi:hypothetical protein
MRENLTYGLMRQGMESRGSPAAPFLDPTVSQYRGRVSSNIGETMLRDVTIRNIVT